MWTPEPVCERCSDPRQPVRPYRETFGAPSDPVTLTAYYCAWCAPRAAAPSAVRQEG